MGELVSAFDRNRELQIQADDIARNPQVIARREREEFQRKKQLLVGELDAFMEMWRSRHRTAASGAPGAKAFAEEKIRATDEYMFQTFGRINGSAGEKSLLAVAEYVETVLDPGMAASLQEVFDFSNTEIAQRNFEARQQRETFWRTEAQKMTPIEAVKEIEKAGCLELRDGVIGLKGALVDERVRIYVRAHKDEVKRILIERGTWTPIE